jgi:hypothetical protein
MNSRPIWKYFEGFLRVVEVGAIVVTAIIIFQIPQKIKEWESAQSERSLNVLLQLDAKLKSKKNRQIYHTIKRNKPLLTQNGGKFSTEDLDFYLDDVTCIADAEDRNLIKLEDIYNWFEDYFVSTLNNKEIGKYLSDIRKESPDSYEGLEVTTNQLMDYKKKLMKEVPKGDKSKKDGLPGLH